ncbi:Sulfate Permease (SulP) Family [Phytophthora cinnamomi]|uniref:Sulfate Permease (SulP) Family n=1 Tax=Phytophthora cinnamomi TaxID=4785 RepID=UPI003559CDE5|nr:Sulfate Permease (SulP) Family [Phytophthora cinnamomi]
MVSIPDAEHRDVEESLTPRLSDTSSCSIYFPPENTNKSSIYTALQSSETKHSFREQWDESVGHGVRRLVRTVRQHATAPSVSVADMTDKLRHDVKDSARFYWQNLLVFQREMLCGVAAMLLMIPETVAFSYAANLDPLNGLYATGFLGLAVSLFGGVPATVAGAAGAVAMVMPTITSGTGSLAYLTYEERLQHLFVAVTIAGVLELLFGLLGLSKLFSMIPRTAHIGFLNGLALMMFISQKTTIEVCKNDSMRFGECEIAGDLEWMSASSPTTWVTVALVLVTMAIMHYFPRVPYIGHLIPPTLVAALIGVGFEFGINRPLLGYDVRTIGDTSPLNGGLPTFALPKFGDVQDWGVVLSTAASIMAVGLFESLMTLQSVVDLKKEQLSQTATRKECIAQGIGNVLCGFFSGMGGCSMIAQSNGNILNGARHRLSSFMGGVCTFLVVFFASSVIERVPVACLTGILFVIVIHTFYWPSLKLIFRVKITDAIAIVLVTVLAAAMNLAIAVIVGVIWQCLVNGWQSGHLLTFRTGMEVVPVVNAQDRAVEHELLTNHEEAKIYYIKGQLLFSSVASFREFFDVLHDPSVVILDMRDCVFADFSAAAALREAAMRYRDAGKTLVARNLDPRSLEMLNHDFGWDSVEHIQIATPATATNGDDLTKSTVDKERASRYSHGSQVSRGSLHQLHIPSPCEASTPYRPATRS